MPGRRRRYSAEEADEAVDMVVDGSRTVAAAARELDIPARTLYRWIRRRQDDDRARQWLDLVTPHFGFLAEHGFDVTDTDGSDFWQLEVIYRSARSAVAVIRSFEFGRVELQLMRLVDGDLPKYPIFVVDSEPLNTFHADDLLALRSPDAGPILARQRGLSPEEVERQLAFWSSALRRYGREFLAGDLRVLDELERMVRDRAGRHRQRVTVWAPERTAAGDQAGTIERVRGTVPGGVDVTARRYRRS